MKTFETPVVDVKKFGLMDILTVSGGNTPSVDTTEPSAETEPSSEEMPDMQFFGETCTS